MRDDADPLGSADVCGAEVVQLFLGDPQSWKKPPVHPMAEQLRKATSTGAKMLFVHSPYVVNLASTNNRIRIPSRKLVIQHADAAADIGAVGLIVHAGYVTASEDLDVGVNNWRKFFARQSADGGLAVPILIENTAGGDKALARRFDALARLWDAIGEFGAGFCLDTCHAFAGGENLVDVVDRAKAITGRIDLVHLNNSRDEFNSARDRHANIADGTIDADQLVAICAAAGAPVVVETPEEGQAADIAYLREKLG